MKDATGDNQKPDKKSPWVPIAKDAAKLFPINRPFTELEALVSLQMDHNNGKKATVRGYAKRWDWSVKKVRCFLPRVGVEIQYPGDTRKAPNQAGQLTPKQGLKQGHKKGTITFIDFKKLEAQRGIKRAQSGAPTIEKEKKKKNTADPRVRVFQEWWMQKYHHRFKTKYLVTDRGKFGAQIKSLLKLPISFEDLQYMAIEFFLDDDPFIAGTDEKQGTGHNVGMFLTRINQNAYSKYCDPTFRETNRGHIIDEEGAKKFPPVQEGRS
jgi:hypothetical protein